MNSPISTHLFLDNVWYITMEAFFKALTIRSPTTYHLSRKLSKLDEPDMPDTAGEARTSS